MKLKRRRKTGKMRGSRTHGHSAKQHKGSGNRGGKGMAGTGKRADQKKTFVIKYMFPYFGKQGFTAKGMKKKKTNEINLRDIQNKYKPGEINLPKHKILGSGEIKDKFIIKARAFSKKAREKIEKAGGKVILLGKKDLKEENKEEKNEEKIKEEQK